MSTRRSGAGLYLDERNGDPLRLVASEGKLRIAGRPLLVPVSAKRFLPQRSTLFFRAQDESELTFRSDEELALKSMEGQTTQYRRAQAWTPTEADVAAFDGRHGCEDVDRVFEISPGTSGLRFRFQEASERAIEAEPSRATRTCGAW